MDSSYIRYKNNHRLGVSQVVEGVTPKKGSTTHLDRPVFNTVAEAKAAVNPTEFVVNVPAPFTVSVVLDAIEVCKQ